MIKSNLSCAIVSLLIALTISISFKMNAHKSMPKLSYSTIAFFNEHK